jgi:hypothetical protein
MEAVRAPSREERIAFLRKRDGDFCMHPDCGKALDFSIDYDNEQNAWAVTLDHWQPLAHQGTWELDNLKLMHRKCNQLKGDLIPYTDGTLPVRRKSTFKRRAEKRDGRAEICNTCMSGRLLGFQEICDDCGSGPQPESAPTLYQLRPKECPHSGPWHCWCCFIGMVPREPASKNVFDGDFLDP